jgi:hypothetical protein
VAQLPKGACFAGAPGDPLMSTDVTGPARPAYVRLPVQFDPARLARDLETAYRFSWPPEEPFGFKDFIGSDVTVFHDGRWKGLALRAQSGDWRRTDPGGPGLEPYAPTEVLQLTPAFQEVIASFHCPLRTVRLSSLPPGAEIAEHCDTYHDFRYGQVRLHVPVVTHRDVLMLIDGQRVNWQPGELWYGDFSRPHRVENNSPINRVHMIIDAEPNEWLLSLFPVDFATEVRSQGVVWPEEHLKVPEEQLARLQCDFIIPAGLIRGIFEMDDGIPGQVDGHVRLVDGRLVMYVGERPLIALAPVAGDRFQMVGWNAERHVRFTAGAERVTGLDLVMRHGFDSTRLSFAIV